VTQRSDFRRKNYFYLNRRAIMMWFRQIHPTKRSLITVLLNGANDVGRTHLILNKLAFFENVVATSMERCGIRVVNNTIKVTALQNNTTSSQYHTYPNYKIIILPVCMIFCDINGNNTTNNNNRDGPLLSIWHYPKPIQGISTYYRHIQHQLLQKTDPTHLWTECLQILLANYRNIATDSQDIWVRVEKVISTNSFVSA
jgi:hypothetical protein